MESQHFLPQSIEVIFSPKDILNKILEKLSPLPMDLPVEYSIENIGSNHKPNFKASVEINDHNGIKKKICGEIDSTKKGAEQKVALKVIRYLEGLHDIKFCYVDKSDLRNFKADNEVPEDYAKVLAEKKEAIDPSKESTDMFFEDLNTNLSRTIVYLSGRFNSAVSQSTYIPNNTNSYKVTLECDFSTIYHLLPNNDNVHYWYELSLSNKSSHLLRILGKSTYDVDGKILLISEVVDGTLEDWVQHNDLINTDKCLTPSFMVIFRDMLKGMNYIHTTLKHAHGEICGKNIFVIGGRAKFANLVAIKNKSIVDDIDSFCKMIVSLFEAQNKLLPSELNKLISNLEKPNELCNSINHPTLLNSFNRGIYRHMALKEVRHKKLYKQFNNAMIAAYPQEKKNHGKLNFSWTKNVTKEPYFSALYYDSNQPQRQTQMLPQKDQQQEDQQQIKYNDSPYDFLRFNGNMFKHAEETEEEIDKYLNSIHPNFLELVHDVLTSLSISIKLPT